MEVTEFRSGTSIIRKITHLWNMVGNTPMIEITYKQKGKIKTIYAKCEHYNLTGSIKDRMALYILQKAYETGQIKKGDKIVEATSGNTGISFAAIGKNLGHEVIILMPDWLSKERKDIIQTLGAEIILISRQRGGFLGSIEISEKMAAADPSIFLPRQFENGWNVEAHYKTTGPEILTQLNLIGKTPDAFVAGVGTGGTVMGVGNYLRSRYPGIKIHPMEPAESPTLSTGYKTGTHRIQGISDEFIPAIVKLDQMNEIIKVSDSDAIIIAQMMAKQLGLAVGISSGANLIAAIEVQNSLGDEANVVTVLPDSNKKYLSTDLVKVQRSKAGNLSNQVELLSYVPIKRAF